MNDKRKNWKHGNGLPWTYCWIGAGMEGVVMQVGPGMEGVVMYRDGQFSLTRKDPGTPNSRRLSGTHASNRKGNDKGTRICTSWIE